VRRREAISALLPIAEAGFELTSREEREKKTGKVGVTIGGTKKK
jgi:hypothetical protein